MKQQLKRVPGLRRMVRLAKGKSPYTPRELVIRRIPPGSVGAEIGVHKGDYSAEILHRARPAKLHLIDPWEHQESDAYTEAWYGGQAGGGQATLDERYRAVQDRFASAIRQGQVFLHRGYSSDVVSDFEDGYFDWVYVDGNHLHDFVLQDLTLYLPKVKEGGLLLGDDYGVEGWWHNGVQTAVDEFIRFHPHLRLEVFDDQFIVTKLPA